MRLVGCLCWVRPRDIASLVVVVVVVVGDDDDVARARDRGTVSCS